MIVLAVSGCSVLLRSRRHPVDHPVVDMEVKAKFEYRIAPQFRDINAYIYTHGGGQSSRPNTTRRSFSSTTRLAKDSTEKRARTENTQDERRMACEQKDKKYDKQEFKKTKRQ